MARFKQFAFKTFGYFNLPASAPSEIGEADFRGFIKIAFIRTGGRLIVDFKEYQLEDDALFFINPGQFYQIDSGTDGTVIYYNRDFYCVEIHDREVACDGLLFRNTSGIPVVYLRDGASKLVNFVIEEIKTELSQGDSNMEEMLRILLKQLIIRSTRLWKQAHGLSGEDAHEEVEVSRSFNRLVDQYYAKFHSVADYAQLLNITPKALTKRMSRYSAFTPNDIIKNRIILEAKRLLVHTQMTVKEIAYALGYDDPSYFIRLFSNLVAVPPQTFRQQYQQAGNRQTETVFVR